MIEQGGKDKGFYRKYILTQGPIPATCSHFWLMALEQKSTAIIMLNKCRERNTQKCEEYWPTSRSQPKIFDDVDIQASTLFFLFQLVKHAFNIYHIVA